MRPPAHEALGMRGVGDGQHVGTGGNAFGRAPVVDVRGCETGRGTQVALVAAD